MFKPRTIFSALTAIILAFAISTQIYIQPAVAVGGTCNPTVGNLPICPSAAPSESASFVDPTATIINPTNITLGEKVYVAPFAELDGTNAPISIAADSNAQDQVKIIASGTGVQIGERVIMAHMAIIKGAANIGTQGSTGPFTDPVLCWEPYPDAKEYELQTVLVEGKSPKLKRQSDRCFRIQAASNENQKSQGLLNRNLILLIHKIQLGYRVRAVLDDNRVSEWSQVMAVGATTTSELKGTHGDS